MIYHVIVTAEDIAHGERGTSEGCPVALALRRLVPGSGVGYCDEKVGYRAWIGPGCGIMPIILPPAAQDFVRCFDQGLPVEPFEFTLGG